MKKFLLVVTLIGVVIGQIFFSSLAEAYNEGDELSVYKYICYNCKKIGYDIFLNGECIRDDTHVDEPCPFFSGNFGQPGYYKLHHWMAYMGDEKKNYVYRNGQWVER